MDHLKITSTKLSVDAVTDLVSSPKCGATSVFLGTTRDNFDGKQVVKLEYEAYESMALKIMKEVCKELRDSWPDIENIAIYHRLGTVPVQDTSVIIAVSSPHRASAIAATKQCIEQLKGRVPIWKKEVYDGETPPQWKENSECSWSNIIKQEPLEIEDEHTDWIEIKNEPIEMDYNDSVVDYSEENSFSINANNQFCNERVHIGDQTSTTHHNSTPTGNRTQNEENYIDDNLVQVKATTAQLKQRIAKFIERKREAANLTNVLDFCGKNLGSETNNSCARIDAIVIRRKDSKSHLKVRRVINLHGPQTLSSMETNRREGTLNAVEERFANAENYLQLNGPVPADIYQRLKIIEDRITELESLSPEYSQYWKNVPTSKIGISHYPTVQKRTFSISDIEARLEMLQKEVSPRK